MSTPLRVLVVEDSEDDTLLLLRELRRGGFEPASERVETEAAMRAALQGQPWDIILCDYALPSFSAPAALALLRETGLDLPFLVVSGKIGEETAVTMMKAGAHDYIMKDNLARLVPAVNRELREAEVRRERKRAEQALLESEARYRTLVEQIPAVTYVAALDEASTTLYVSPQIEAMIGFTPAEYAANPGIWHERLHPDDRERVLAEVLESRARGVPLRSEYRMIARDGRVVGLRDEATLVRDDAGRPLFLQGVMLDITERKRLEREILDVTWRERRRVGQELHDGLGQLLTGVALLGKALASKLAARSLPEAADAGKIAGLIGEAIDQTRLMARGLHPLELEHGGIAPALTQLTSSVAKSSGLACHFQSDPNIPALDEATALDLYRIAQEAVNNAVRHAEARHIRVGLIARENRVVLTVQDDGIGIREERDPSKGLGLRTMRYRAGLMGATFDIRRAPNGGTLVTCSVRPGTPTENASQGS